MVTYGKIQSSATQVSISVLLKAPWPDNCYNRGSVSRLVLSLATICRR